MSSSRQKSEKGTRSQDVHSEEMVWAGTYVDAEMRSVHLQALHRLADYRNGPTPRVPMLNQDYTFHLLHELIYYSPNPESFMRIAKQIIGCTNRAAIQSLAEEYIEKLIIPSKLSLMKPLETLYDKPPLAVHTLITADWGNTTPMLVDRKTFVVTPKTLHEASKDITLLKSMVSQIIFRAYGQTNSNATHFPRRSWSAMVLRARSRANAVREPLRTHFLKLSISK